MASRGWTLSAAPTSSAAATKTETAGWAKHDEALADFYLARVVVRRDVHGAYASDGSPFTSRDPLDRDLLIRHCQGKVTVGAHSISTEGKCKTVVWDIDAHDDTADTSANWRCALRIVELAAALGLTALICDSNGKGGFHVRVFFKKTVGSRVAWWLGERIKATLKAEGLVCGEAFPKQAELSLNNPYGNWPRLPGRHPKRPHWTRIFDSRSDRWLAGEAAALRLLKVAGDDTKELLAAYQAEQAAQPKQDKPRNSKARDQAPDEATVREAVDYLPDALADNYDSWLGVGMALHDWDSTRGLELWRSFSRRCPARYESGACDDKWATFTSGGGLTVGSIFHEAKQNGWRPQQSLAQPSVNGNGRQHEAASENEMLDELNCGPEAIEDPHRLARVFKDARCAYYDQLTKHHELTLRCHNGEWSEWDGAYRNRDTTDLRSEIVSTVKDEFDRIQNLEIQLWGIRGKKDADGKPCSAPKARKITRALIADVLQALAGELRVPSKTTSPAWLIDSPPFPAHEVLPARNALVHLPGLIANQDSMRPPSPTFWCPYALDYDFDLSAPKPLNWFTFLGKEPVTPEGRVKLQLWPGDSESIEALQEWFGYSLIADTSHQKILLLIGPKRSGKGTIARIIQALIGAANVAYPTLSSLATNFGLAPLIGKPLAVITDARLSGRTDIVQTVERLLSISGEDGQTIARKYLPDWTGTLPTRFMIISNELPRIPETSGALAGRMVILELTESFYGREDRALTTLLLSELPGILLWAIEGWQRLKKRGHFIQPESGKPLVEEMEDLASPVGMFVRECCAVGIGREVSVARLFDRWKRWCIATNREHFGDKSTFGRNLRTVVPGLKTKPVRRNGKWDRDFVGIAIEESNAQDSTPQETAEDR